MSVSAYLVAIAIAYAIGASVGIWVGRRHAKKEGE